MSISNSRSGANDIFREKLRRGSQRQRKYWGRGEHFPLWLKLEPMQGSRMHRLSWIPCNLEGNRREGKIFFLFSFPSYFELLKGMRLEYKLQRPGGQAEESCCVDFLLSLENTSFFPSSFSSSRLIHYGSPWTLCSWWATMACTCMPWTWAEALKARGTAPLAIGTLRHLPQ